jgi:hypothetical protein
MIFCFLRIKRPFFSNKTNLSYILSGRTVVGHSWKIMIWPTFSNLFVDDIVVKKDIIFYANTNSFLLSNVTNLSYIFVHANCSTVGHLLGIRFERQNFVATMTEKLTKTVSSVSVHEKVYEYLLRLPTTRVLDSEYLITNCQYSRWRSRRNDRLRNCFGPVFSSTMLL